MRYLTIVRHCKASPAELGVSDYDRTLNERGRVQAGQLRQWASDPVSLARFGPTTALVSAAARTRETFRLAFEGTSFVAHCEFSERIYNGRREVSAEDLMIDLAAIDPGTTSLLVVAHNPTVLNAALALATRTPKKLLNGHYPLGGAYVFELPDDGPVGLQSYELVASYIPD